MSKGNSAREKIETKKEMNTEETLEYRILKSTRNAGQYVGDRVASLSGAKTMIRAEHPGRRIRWREEGSDVCAYLSAEDMEDADKAVARLRPVAAC